jgi:deoxyribonucleoside regulator
VGDSLYALAGKGGGSVIGLAGPTIVQDAHLADLLRNDPAIASTLRRAEACRVMLYSPGAVTPDSVLTRSGYVTAAQLEALRSAGAAGDVMSHFIRADGTVADAGLDQRTLSISLDAVRACPAVIAVASGEAKAAATASAVTSGLCTAIVTDSSIAAAVLGG